MTLLVGITGGIGSGKSTLCKYLESKNFKVHDSDKEVSLLYKNPTEKFINFLKKNGFNEAIKGCEINKKVITSIIFNNNELKKILEKHIHKELKTKRDRFIKNNKKEKVLFIDIPLLFENNLDDEFDKIIAVISTKKNRLKRILFSKKFSKKVFDNITKHQTLDKNRKMRSDYTITNNGSKKDFILKINTTIIEAVK